MEPQPITLLNTGLPLALVSGAALAIPRLILPRETRSQLVLLAAIVASAGLVFLLGLMIFAAAYALQGADVAGAFAASPEATVLSLARSTALGALLWLPLLAISGLTLAQKIEKRRGEDIMRRGR